MAPVADVVSTVPTVVLAVYAHPDDPEVACGGTLARWAAEGAAVHLLLTCTGDKGTADPQTDPADLVRVRAAEVAAGAAALGRGQQGADHVADIREVARLRPVADNGQRLSRQLLREKYAKDRPIRAAGARSRPIDVEQSE